MKGWTLDSLKEKGVSFTVTGGVAEPVSAPKRAGKKRPPLTAPRNRPAVDEIVVELPVPPSVNSCWVNVPGIGRVRSPAYRAWHKTAAQEAMLARGRIDGAYTIRLEIGTLPRGGDIGNRTKPTEDLLAGLLTDDDSLCTKQLVEWAKDTGADIPTSRMRVTLRRAAA